VEMKFTIDALERERDFYFDKLRDIEVSNAINCFYSNLQHLQMIVPECDQTNGSEMSQAVLDVLYATEVMIAILLWFTTLSILTGWI
jgi:hypothetical protein